MTSAPLFETLGCRLNTYETEAIRKLSVDAGLSDAVVINTCAVTAEAVRHAKQKIRKMRRNHPDRKMVVTGCAAQIDPDMFARMPEVDHVLGNHEKLSAKSWRDVATNDRGVTANVSDIMAVTTAGAPLIDGFGTRSRAYVEVQNGCDHRCTFCIIPFGRGNSRSVSQQVVVEQVRKLRAKGFNEIVLTGVDMTSWGADLGGAPRLGDLVKLVLRSVPDLPRLRISSIDSIEADPVLIDIICHEPRLMPHLHLSLQAGDNMILKRMKRRHSRDNAIRFCQTILSARPDMAFGADIIAGFPTETDEMFQRSMALVAECNLTWLHVFPYSIRLGTPAARMPQVEKSTIKQRAARLRDLGADQVERHLSAQIGQPQRILMETARMGRTECFAEVVFDSDQLVGQIVNATITAHQDSRLVVENHEAAV